jgi:multidrug efflux pump subunit AcrA (membrane-fusion protein)
MTQWVVRALLLGGVLALAAGGLVLWGRSDGDTQTDAEKPIAAPSRVRASGGEAIIEVPGEEFQRLGLQLAGLTAARSAPEVRLPGELVPDPERTTAVRAPLAGKLSISTGGHWPRFGERVAEGDVLAQVSDALPLSAPRTGVVTAVGAQPGEMVDAGQLLLELTDYGRPIARIAWGAAAPPPPASVTILAPGSEGQTVRVRAELVGAAATADPVTRLPAYLYRAGRNWPGARPGLAVTALVPTGPARDAVLVPDSALVQWEGLVWAYVQREPGRFARRRVPTDRPAGGGFLAGTGWAAGDSVVVAGAEQLLSEEFRARVTVGDEQGE